MNLKGILRFVWTRLGSFIDTDKDGRIEISDMPGAMAKIATMRDEGQALIDASEAALGALIGAAKDGDVTSGGTYLSPDDVRAAFAAAKAKSVEAGELARAELAKG